MIERENKSLRSARVAEPIMWIVQWEWKKEPGQTNAGGGTSYPPNEAAADAEVARLKTAPQLAWAKKVPLYPNPSPSTEVRDNEDLAEAIYNADFRVGHWAEWSEIDEDEPANKRLKDQYRAYAKAALSALSTSAEQVEITDEMVERIATLYGNFIPGHGWTGFGPTPAQITAALSPIPDNQVEG